MMIDFTLHELACFDAVVSEGSFQAAATLLNRTHPAVHTAVGNLESRIETKLLDRSSYRVKPTPEGEAFLERARSMLREADDLQAFTQHLARGEETELRIIVGDLCPTAQVIKLLRRFFDECPNTRLHLHFEALGGPQERLLAGEADLILHHIDQHDSRMEWIDLFPITLVPVVAPGFLPFEIHKNITPKQMKQCVQCIIRDSARNEQKDYFLIEGSRSWTVADQLMKKELILLGMGWGHMPLHLIQKEILRCKLLSIEGKHFKRSAINIVAARLRNRTAGPIADRLWRFLSEPSLQRNLF
jgi:DNA-binding transcriptional LysR family regulator